MLKTLLLWDIDGTLIDSGGAGERALKVALQKEFGLADDLAWLDYFGRTDVWIARTILTHHRLAATPEQIRRFLEGYLSAVSDEMNNPRARTLPGIPRILETVAQGGTIAQGLLTGNLQRGAAIKLGHFNLWRYFQFGAYADDSELRNDLGPHAVRRANDHHRATFNAERVFVIGDTPHDIECGKAIGAQTIAVATGRHSASVLRGHQPWAVYENLEDAAGFLQAVGAASSW
jgi:phosphoglycolate phosphatase